MTHTKTNHLIKTHNRANTKTVNDYPIVTKQQLDGLSPTNRRIVELTAEGLTMKAVGKELGLPTQHIGSYLWTIRQELGIDGYKATLSAAIWRGRLATAQVEIELLRYQLDSLQEKIKGIDL